MKQKISVNCAFLTAYDIVQVSPAYLIFMAGLLCLLQCLV